MLLMLSVTHQFGKSTSPELEKITVLWSSAPSISKGKKVLPSNNSLQEPNLLQCNAQMCPFIARLIVSSEFSFTTHLMTFSIDVKERWLWILIFVLNLSVCPTGWLTAAALHCAHTAATGPQPGRGRALPSLQFPLMSQLLVLAQQFHVVNRVETILHIQIYTQNVELSTFNSTWQMFSLHCDIIHFCNAPHFSHSRSCKAPLFTRATIMSLWLFALYSLGVWGQTFDLVGGTLPALFLSLHVGGSQHPSCSSTSNFLLPGSASCQVSAKWSRVNSC